MNKYKLDELVYVMSYDNIERSKYIIERCNVVEIQIKRTGILYGLYSTVKGCICYVEESKLYASPGSAIADIVIVE